MKKYLIVLILVSTLNGLGQINKDNSSIKKHTIYGEVFGQGFSGSINYDKIVNINHKVMNSHTFGLTYTPESLQFGGGLYVGGHYAYNFIFGKKNNHLDLGIGISALYNNNWGWGDKIYTYLTPKIGYRYQRVNGGVFFKANINVFLALVSLRKGDVNYFQEANDIEEAIWPWPGFSLGYTF